jgi:CHASE3 domain sensor protein
LDKIEPKSCCKLSRIILLAIIVLSMCLLSVNQSSAQIDQTTSKLQVAITTVDQAFTAVLDAEKAGANVTDLLSQLSYVDSILARAENSYRTGDFNQAMIQADIVLPTAQQITLTAQSAKQTAKANTQNAFYTTVAFTVICSFVFVLVLFMVWRRFKRNYIKKLARAKPELVG